MPTPKTTTESPKEPEWSPAPIERGEKISLTAIEFHPDFQKAAKGFAEFVAEAHEKETGETIPSGEVFGRLMDIEGVATENGDIRFPLIENGEEVGAFNAIAGFWRRKQ